MSTAAAITSSMPAFPESFLPARAEGAVSGWKGPPGTLYHFLSPTEVPGPPTYGGLHLPQSGLCGGTEVAQGLSGPTMLVASPGGKALKGVPQPTAPRDAADPSRVHPSSWLEFPQACHRQRCRQAVKMPLPAPCQGQLSMPTGSTVLEGTGTCILPGDAAMACLRPKSSSRWKKNPIKN